MTADIRIAARDEAFKNHYSHKQVRDRYDADLLITGFMDGAEWAQSRITPTREDIADALAGAYDEWCVLLEEFLAGRGDDPGSEYEYKADAILALLAGLAEGEAR